MRNMLQRFSPLINIYRVPTINRYNEDEFGQNKKVSKLQADNMEIKSDLCDLRYARRYPHCLKIFNANFNEKIYDLVRSVCQKRMILYDENDFIIGNYGVRITEFENIWNTMYPNEIFPFLASDYALFYHLIEFQSHNIRALPINNYINKKEENFVEYAEMMEEEREKEKDIEAHKVYYQSYQFVPVQPYNNQTHSRLLNLMYDFIDNKKYKNNIKKKEEEIETLLALKNEYISNISYLLKTFKHDGIPLSDFARLFEFKYHNVLNTKQYSPLLSFNPDIITIGIDKHKLFLNIGELHRSLSNILVVMGALITPKTKPIQQQIIFPLNIGSINWMILNCMDYYNHNKSSNIYSIPWIKIKEIGQNANNENSIIYKHRNKFFGNSPNTKLWTINDTNYIKQHSFYKYATNVTLTHKYIYSEQELNNFWPNNESNLMLYRRPIAPILDYDVLILGLLNQSNDMEINMNKYKEFKSILFYKFIDELMDKYASEYTMKDISNKNILYNYLSIMTLRILYILSTYINEYTPQYNISYIRWS
eukprot:60318_1